MASICERKLCSCTGAEIALLAVSAAGVGASVNSAVNAKDATGTIQPPTPPPDATTGEQNAQTAAQVAKKNTLLTVGDFGGRSSTILTGGQLGLTGTQTGGKTLLGS